MGALRASKSQTVGAGREKLLMAVKEADEASARRRETAKTLLKDAWGADMGSRHAPKLLQSLLAQLQADPGRGPGGKSGPALQPVAALGYYAPTKHSGGRLG